MAIARLAVLLAIACLAPPGAASAQISIIHSFQNVDHEGAIPVAGVIAVGSRLYGTTTLSWTPGSGTVFSMNFDGSDYRVLREFINPDTSATEPSSLGFSGVVAVDGRLFGTTVGGGTHGAGTLFSMDLDGGDFSVLHAFADRFDPVGNLVTVGSKLYGLTGSNSRGSSAALYSVNTNGSDFRLIADFPESWPSGWPELPVTDGTKLYGTIDDAHTGGLVYSVGLDGHDFTILHTFTRATDGSVYVNGLTVSDGRLYGMANGGGTHDQGTIYSLNVDGSDFRVLHDFGGGAGDGSRPTARSSLLLSGSTLYGVTRSGGEPYPDLAPGDGLGTLFSLGVDGSDFTLLHEFGGNAPFPGTLADGLDPLGPLQIVDSTLFGVTYDGGAYDLGSVYAFALPESSLANPEPSGLALAGAGLVVAVLAIAHQARRVARQ